MNKQPSGGPLRRVCKPEVSPKERRLEGFCPFCSTRCCELLTGSARQREVIFIWLRTCGGVRAVSPERPDGGRWWQMAVPDARCTVPCCSYVACNQLVMTRLDAYDPCWRLHLLFTKILPDYPNLSERPDPARIIFNDGVVLIVAPCNDHELGVCRRSVIYGID